VCKGLRDQRVRSVCAACPSTPHRDASMGSNSPIGYCQSRSDSVLGQRRTRASRPKVQNPAAVPPSPAAHSPSGQLRPDQGAHKVAHQSR
jgi:bacterioferritin-associated ferredoxin